MERSDLVSEPARSANEDALDVATPASRPRLGTRSALLAVALAGVAVIAILLVTRQVPDGSGAGVADVEVALEGQWWLTPTDTSGPAGVYTSEDILLIVKEDGTWSSTDNCATYVGTYSMRPDGTAFESSQVREVFCATLDNDNPVPIGALLAEVRKVQETETGLELLSSDGGRLAFLSAS